MYQVQLRPHWNTFCAPHALPCNMQIPTNDVSFRGWTIRTSGAFQFGGENALAQQKMSRDMAVNKKVMQKQGGGMRADGQAQPAPHKTVH